MIISLNLTLSLASNQEHVRRTDSKPATHYKQSLSIRNNHCCYYQILSMITSLSLTLSLTSTLPLTSTPISNSTKHLQHWLKNHLRLHQNLKQNRIICWTRTRPKLVWIYRNCQYSCRVVAKGEIMLPTLHGKRKKYRFSPSIGSRFSTFATTLAK